MTLDFIQSARNWVRSLPQAEFNTLRLAVAHEHRRRERKRRHNAEWTAGEGLVPCMEASIKLIENTKEEKPK